MFVLIVSTNASIAKKLSHVLHELESSVTIHSVNDPFRALEGVANIEPDIVLIDSQLPDVSTSEFLQWLHCVPQLYKALIGLLIMSGSPQPSRQTLDCVDDFMKSDMNSYEWKIKLRLLLTLRQQQKIIQELRQIQVPLKGENTVTYGNIECEKEILSRLALARQYKDKNTGEHLSRFGEVSAAIAHELGMKAGYCDVLRHAAPMHDIGKIGVLDHILNKPTKLTSKEKEIMQNHTLIGHKILKW